MKVPLCVLHLQVVRLAKQNFGTSDFVNSHSFHTPFLGKLWHHTAPCNVIIRTFLILSNFQKSQANRHFSANYSTKCNGTRIWVATAGATRRGVIACGDGSCIIHDSSVFPQLKNNFLEWTLKISWNLSQFPETEEGHSVLGRCPRKFIIWTT